MILSINIKKIQRIKTRVSQKSPKWLYEKGERNTMRYELRERTVRYEKTRRASIIGEGEICNKGKK